MQDNWLKVLPIALMRARTAPQKEGLSLLEYTYGRPFLCTDIVIDPDVLRLTNYVTQLSAFQQALKKLQEVTPDTTSESNKPLFEPGTEFLIKTLGSGGQSLKFLWEGPSQVILSSPTAVKVAGIDSWVHYTQLRGDTLTRTSDVILCFHALTFYFPDGPDKPCELASADSKNPESAI